MRKKKTKRTPRSKTSLSDNRSSTTTKLSKTGSFLKNIGGYYDVRSQRTIHTTIEHGWTSVKETSME